MSLSQSREGNFNPASPHSSSGIADSFKGTPDTRLTAFSPEDGSARSAKVPGSLNLISREAVQAKYPVSSPSSLDLSKKFYQSDLQLERDPFITTSGPAEKTVQKLSPTASTFFPLQTQLAPRLPISTSEPDNLTKEKLREVNYGYHHAPHYGQAAEEQDLGYVHSLLSTDTGLSRCLVISRPGGGLRECDIERYITVNTPNAT